jgi:hypothetical protein
MKFALFDITDMYTSIPTEQLKPVILQVLSYQQTDPEVTKEIILLLDIILKQNCFHFSNRFYVQEEGLVIGAPTSSILSEYYLQHLGEKYVIDILQKFKILGYFRCIDNILIIYNKKTTNIEHVLSSFNDLSSNLIFALEQEENNKMNFLSIAVSKREGKNQYKNLLQTNCHRQYYPSRLVAPRNKRTQALNSLLIEC